MKKITTLIAFFSLIVGGVNAQHPVAISAQEWSKKNPNPLKYGVQDFVNFHSTGQLKKGPVLHEGITDFNQVIKETRKVSKDRTLKQVVTISKFLGREVTLKEFYSNLKVMRVKMQSSFVLNAYDYESPTNESWVNHNPSVYEMICFVADGKVFPVNHVICLNATNAAGLLSVVTDNATVVGGEVVREAKPQQEEGDDQDAAAREALKALKSDPNSEPGDEEGNNESSDKDPHINHDHTKKTVVTPDGKTTMIFNIYGNENRNVAVNKGDGTTTRGTSPAVIKEEVYENQLPPMQQVQPQQAASQQTQYRQTCACGGVNGQHYSNCSTLNRVATNSCNSCGNSGNNGNYRMVRQKSDPAVIADGVIDGAHFIYDVAMDWLAPNGRGKQQSRPVNNYYSYNTNPTPPNLGQGNDYGGVTDYVVSGLNGNGLINGGSLSNGLGFDGVGVK